MPPAAVPVQWPALKNPRPDDPVRNLRKLLQKRTSDARWYGHVGKFCHSWLYRFGRGTRLLAAATIGLFAASPVKSAVDVLTAAPIALLAWPPFREAVLKLKWASLAFLGIILLRVIYTAYRRTSARKGVRKTIRQTQRLTLPMIELVQAHGVDTRSGHGLGPELLNVAVKGLLDSMLLVTRHGLDVPEGVTLYANLMLPMDVLPEGETSRTPGLGIVQYNTQAPSNPSWTKIIKGDLVAGTVLQTGIVEVVEDTRDPGWWGIFDGVRSRSFVTFPISTPDQGIMGVINLDADKPMIFRRADVAKHLGHVLAPGLRLFAQLLAASKELADPPKELAKPAKELGSGPNPA